MKTALILLVLSGVILYVNAACNSDACTKVTDTSDCTQLNSYLDCLHKEADGCKATPGDILKKAGFETLIGTENIQKKVQGCGACAVTVSATTLLLALVAAFMKM